MFELNINIYNLKSIKNVKQSTLVSLYYLMDLIMLSCFTTYFIMHMIKFSVQKTQNFLKVFEVDDHN